MSPGQTWKSSDQTSIFPAQWRADPKAGKQISISHIARCHGRRASRLTIRSDSMNRNQKRPKDSLQKLEAKHLRTTNSWKATVWIPRLALRRVS